jgi:hypothetical protein
MNSYSQAGQDRFVYEVLIKTGVLQHAMGTFIDIGCAGNELSNTRALEEMGWLGLLVDIAPQPETTKRPSRFMQADATKADLMIRWSTVDYLSLDVDEATLDALKNLPLDKVRFRVITIEHDAYRFGDKLRPFEREILTKAGYKLICADVCNPVPFEDWWVDAPYEKYAERFKCQGKHWTEILKNANK